MDYDVVILGAGLSGLAAGIRLAHFGKRVCIVEQHALPGGLNSYYRRGGRLIDVGLHAMTNLAAPDNKRAPLNRLLRQLRLKREDLDLCPQSFSEIAAPRGTLAFTNRPGSLEEAAAARFPEQMDGLRALIHEVRTRDTLSLDATRQSARDILPSFLTDPDLIDMLFLPLMYYGNAEEHDMDFNQFCIMFQSVLLEGLSRPRAGMRHILEILLGRYRASGGTLRFRTMIAGLEHDGRRVIRARLDDGESLGAGSFLSCAGCLETLRLCRPSLPETASIPEGQLSFVETIFFLDRSPADLGLGSCIRFFHEAERFRYARPESPLDPRSGVICAPGNYQGCENSYVGSQIRMTNLADHRFWLTADTDAYAAAKQHVLEEQLDVLERHVPGVRAAVVDTDMFTPRTIQRYTGHINGCVYGTPQKRRDGTTPLDNLFLCGTDQGFLGIVGSLLSGVSIANAHLLR